VTKDTGRGPYQGNKGYKGWTLENWNATNVYETGWLNGEFEKAEANLRANVNQGAGATFRYTGLPGTSPLPITLAHLWRSTDANNPAAYTGNIWTNSTFVGQRSVFPDPPGLRSNLYLSSSTSVAGRQLAVLH
jgi:hypothetical protein